MAGVFALALTFTRWRRIGQVLLGLALAALWLSATPAFANWLSSRVTPHSPHVKLETLPRMDAVILLGGASCGRILYALKLYRAGNAPVILISAGDLPWERSTISEAEQIADFLVNLGAPRSALILETKSRTTRENALNTTAIFRQHGWRNGLLVTSDLHMARAVAAFHKVGLDVLPAVYNTSSEPLDVQTLLDLLPDADSLAWTTLAIKEVIGLQVYRLRGWA